MLIDTSSEFGQRAEKRLRDEVVVWLTTVRPDGTPEPSPVWFFWDGSTALIYSQPNRTKLRNIGRDPRVSLNFNSTNDGGDVVIFTGEARVDSGAPPANQHPKYLAKYDQHIAGIGMTPASFAAAYSVAIRVTPTKLRGF
jgi:PPOX class probable F420-dependent enzyme